MSNPTDLSDFTLKQLFHLYQLSEADQLGLPTKDLKSELISDQDFDLFSKILAKKPNENITDEQQIAEKDKGSHHLSEIFDSLIDDIDL